MAKKKISLSDPVQSLNISKSVTAQKLEKAGILTIRELLWFLPLKIENIPDIKSFKFAVPDTLFKGTGTIQSIIKKPVWKKGSSKKFGGLSNIVVNINDKYSDQSIKLKWFNAYPSVIKQLEVDQTIIFHGEVSSYNDLFQIISPEITIPASDELISQSNDHLDLEVQYGTLGGIGPKQIKRLISKIPILLLDNIQETLPSSILKKHNFMSESLSFKILHALVFSTLEERALAKKRLIYQEFFEEQLNVFKRKISSAKIDGIKFNLNENIISQTVNSFEFMLTIDQISCLKDIANDLKSSRPMVRLLQGDVGSGKTCIAIAASIMASNSGYQIAIMCPTESLALQHYSEFSSVVDKLNINVGLLTSSTSGQERKKIIEDLSTNKLSLIIGTHSLISDDLVFKNLGLIVIDEQHKFGVEQRLKLLNKNKGTNCLIMSATPIPRSLRLTQFGDLDVSTIKSMPKIRKGHKTRIIKPHNLQNFFNFVETRLSMNEQAYIIAPVIFEDSLKSIFSVESIYEKFRKIFPDKVIECLHGKMKPVEKQSIFKKFKEQKIDILIATSVIEVGIDNHNATIMGIFGPEHFGLSSLHQLRGRVGRGNKTGFCFLMADQDINHSSYKRLEVLEKHTDGFIIAEEDLKNRGHGDLFGVFQSGKDSTKHLADINQHSEVLISARTDLEIILKDRPSFINLDHLSGPSDNKILPTI